MTTIRTKLTMVGLLCSVMLLSSGFTNLAEAAHVSFTPGQVSITLLPGESASIPVTSTLTQASRGEYASFDIALKTGNAGAWFGRGPSVNLNSPFASSNSSLFVKVPEGTAGGRYSASFTASLTSITRFPVTADDLVINVEVEAGESCVDVPTFKDITAQQTAVMAKNNKPYPVDFTGQVVLSDGCTLENAWYQLTDEYGELNDKQALTVAEDGSFNATIEILASREGNDKDGRLYTVTFGAENEAGKGESGATSIVVAHDNKK